MDIENRSSIIGSEQLIGTLPNIELSATSSAAQQNLSSILTAYQDASTTIVSNPNTTMIQDMMNDIPSILNLNTSSSYSNISRPNIPEAFMGMYFTIRVLMSLLAICGNGLTIVAIIKFKSLQNTTNILVANLAVADMITGLLMPIVISHYLLSDLSMYVPMCLVEKTFSAISIRVNLIFILWIAVDRYFYIAYPLKYVLWMTAKRALSLTFLKWFYIVVDSTLIMTFVNILEMGGTCKLALIIHPTIYNRYINPQCYICFLVTIACYVAIAKIAVKQGRSIAALNQPFETIEASVNCRQKKIAKMMFTVLASHIISWVPIACLTIIVQNMKTSVTLVMELVTTAIFYTNSFLNPMIYAWKSKEFNVAFRKLLRMTDNVIDAPG